MTNTGTLEVSAGTLDLQAGISGTGSDVVSGASTLEFDANVAARQTASFTGSGGTLDLTARAQFAGVISGFDTAGAGSNDTIQVGGPWVFTGFTENAGGHGGRPRVRQRRKHHKPHAARRLCRRQLRSSGGAGRKHADNLHVRKTRLTCGALSMATGQIQVRCADQGETVVITWTERGAPAVAPPTETGFGAVLIRATIEGQLGGTISQEWKPEGLVVRLVVPHARLTG